MQRARAYDGLRLFMMTGGVGVGVGVSCPKLNFEIQLVCANMFLAFQTNFGEITSLFFFELVSTSFQSRYGSSQVPRPSCEHSELGNLTSTVQV